MLIKNRIGTMSQKLLFLIFFGGTIYSWFQYTPPHKIKTRNFRGIVHIWFLDNIKLSLKWALDQSSPTKLRFLCIMGFFNIFGKLRRIMGGSKFRNKPKILHQKFCFDIANQLLGGFHPNPNEPINPPSYLQPQKLICCQLATFGNKGII